MNLPFSSSSMSLLFIWGDIAFLSVTSILFDYIRRVVSFLSQQNRICYLFVCYVEEPILGILYLGCISGIVKQNTYNSSTGSGFDI
ncbi:hypothetical protein DAPPUDRAFT_303909 [Daphnia pulex]|uniref:Uncharacterized protein n=1 Tax=Daphnia pulex TaxID=6669 RepID=E9GIA7_DAPPU|nr:hypothetical protein DAPPUDRAFT_303909 [Daphnia pulex]|eukprot:EFX80803.1 hypothetical protein DAPPUDRAFT_303909 [Daphnia pulex]